MQEIAAQSNQLKLEKEQNWETYRVGGTCISGTGGNIFVGDVDDDGTLEILTGGHTYYLANGTRTPSEAPLRIWNWNGQNLTLEKALNWAGRIRGIYADDADGDGTTEIITIASVTNITGTNTQLGVWRWNNQQLVLEASYEY